MRIQKGGIRREIDGRRLAEYREKGYAATCEAPAQKPRKKPEAKK